jgi:hypothetical protein
MSILSALSENRHEKKNLADLAKLPQALIMQMGQRKELTQEEVAMVISKKAEAIESAARQKALEQGGGQMPSVIEQDMMKIAQAENPAPLQQMMPQQMAQQQMPQGPEDVGIAQNPVPPMQMAGGGIIAFDEGGDVDVDPEDDYKDLIDQANEDATNDEIFGIIAAMEDSRTDNAGVGIRTGENKNITQDTRERAKQVTNEDQARKYNVGNLRPSGFTYPGQVGLSKGKFAMFDSPESGINALNQDIGIKLNRGLDTPTKFISVYAPASDNNDVKAYSSNVAKMLGIGPNDRIPNTPEARQILAKAIIRQEGADKATAAFAQGGIAHFDIGGEIDTAGAELDALRSGTKTLEEELMRGGSRGGEKSPELKAAYENALALRRQKEAEYEALMNKAGVNKPSFYPQSSLSTKRPEANPIVKREATGASPVIKPTVTVPPVIPDELRNAQIAPPQNKPPAQDLTPREKAEEETFNFMKYIQDRQARTDKAAENDKNIALLSAGLGILGGTSPYAFENIGKGAQMGVQQLGQLQKLRASQDIAGDKMLGTAYNAQTLNKIRRDQLTQGREQRSDKLAQDLIINKNSYIQKRMKDYNMDEMMLNNLRRQQAKGKLDPDKLADLQFYEQQIRNIEKEANRMFPSQDLGSGYSARKIGQ